jgi:hypothetical protein
VSDYERLGVFYLGRAGGQPVLVDAQDLTTHGVIVGATGSGKTGLGISLLEEAAIDGVPVLAIDPKGDLSNLLLTFPELRDDDFARWVDPDAARHAGVSVPAFAAMQASRWREGLAASDQRPERARLIAAGADVVVYTPGSDAGVPLAMLRSLEAPSPAVRASAEALRERVQSTTSALLGLVGIDADPITSREHVLVATLLGQAWAAGRGYDLPSLVLAIQTPPFASIGVLDLESFYPSDARFALVMALNNLLASPSAAGLMRGKPLDIDALLHGPTGKPRVAIVSIAHLGDQERKALVTMLLGNVVSWMRAQTGTSSLRALLYLDEAAGYLPPVANPPTKPLFLTLFKQARAFGLGVVVATQNPVDVDYKVLSNAGTWMVGRLQTARDRSKVMEGLAAAAEQSGSPLAADELEQAIGALEGREFILHGKGRPPFVFKTRCTLSYLRGPMSLREIASLRAPETHVSTGGAPASVVSSARPVVPPDVTQIFVPVAQHGDAAALRVGYAPCVLGVARVRHADKKLGIDQTTNVLLAASIEPTVIGVDWARAYPLTLPPETLTHTPHEGAIFQAVPSAGLQGDRYDAWRKSFVEHLCRALTVELLSCKAADLVSLPRESERDFRIRLAVRLRELRDEEIAKLREKWSTKLRTAEEKARRAWEKLEEKRASQSQKQTDAVLSVGVSALGAFLGTKTFSVANAQRAARAAKGVKRASASGDDVTRAEQAFEVAKAALATLQSEVEQKVRELAAKHDPETAPLDRAVVTPKKSQTEVVALGLGFLPDRPDPSGTWRPAWPG